MIDQTVSHYRVLDKLGSGGMGVVYLAEDLRLGRRVALKFLPEASLTDPLAVARFEREARTASSLSHPNICTIHGIEEHDGRRFIVMELIEGQTLDRVISTGPLDVRRLIDIAIQVSDALDAAHARDILHRDVKPSNIFLTRRDQVKVVDFGLAKSMVHRAALGSGADVSLEHVSTSAGTAVGTVAYMSPEHARGDTLDARSDLFSFGLVLYEMATGTQAFRGRTTAVVFDQILHHVPPPPSVLNPNLPPRLQQIIARAVEKDRWLRYQTASDIRADLQRLKRDTESGSRDWVASGVPSAISVSEAWSPAGSVSEDAHAMSGNWGSSGYSISPEAPTVVDVRAPSSVTPAPVTPPPVNAPAPVDTPLPVDAAPPQITSTAPTVTPPAPVTPVAAPSMPASAAGVQVAVTPAVHVDPLPTESISVPAHSSQKPAAAAAVPGSKSGQWIAVAAILIVVLGIATFVGGWRWLRRPGVVSAGATGASTATPAPPPPAAVAPAAEPGTPAPAPATVPDPKAATPGTSVTTTPGPVEAPAKAAAPPPARRAGTTAPKPADARANGKTVTPAPTTPPEPAPAAPTPAMLLDAAKTQLARGQTEAGLEALANLAATHPTSPAALEALTISADTQLAQNRLEAALSSWRQYAARGGRSEPAAEGLLRIADAAARQRQRPGDELARAAFGELLTRYPGDRQAVRALMMKMALEDRMKLKQNDEQFGGNVNASNITLREVAAGAGSAPVAEVALWRLAEKYRDRDRHALAAAALVDLGTRFPNTRYDAFFQAAELYEDELNDKARARELYAKVPPTSPKYATAQRRSK